MNNWCNLLLKKNK